MKKVFLWAGLHAYVDNGKIVKIIDEGDYTGRKYFESVELDGNLIKFKMLNGVVANYDTSSGEIEFFEPVHLKVKIEDAGKIMKFVDALDVILANLSRIGTVDARILMYNPVDAMYATIDRAENTYISPEEFKNGDYTPELFDRFVTDLTYSTLDCEESIAELILENLGEIDKTVRIEVDTPEGLVVAILNRKTKRWEPLEGAFEIEVPVEKMVKTKLAFISYKNAPLGKMKIRVLDGDRVIASKEAFVYTC